MKIRIVRHNINKILRTYIIIKVKKKREESKLFASRITCKGCKVSLHVTFKSLSILPFSFARIDLPFVKTLGYSNHWEDIQFITVSYSVFHLVLFSNGEEDKMKCTRKKARRLKRKKV